MKLFSVFAISLWGVAYAAPSAHVVASVGDGPATDRAVEAKLGQTVTLYAALRKGRTWFTDAPALKVRGRRIARKRVRPLAQAGAQVQVRWLQVEPSPHHTATPPPNPGNPAYSNSVLFGPRHGKWLGYDTLEYAEHPLNTADAAPQLTRATPTHPGLQVNRGLGTLRYKVVVEVDGQAHASRGAEAVKKGGIDPRVFRVSWRNGDDLVGWLTSLFNVPNVFGSAGRGRAHQTDRHQGADCADVIVGAARKAGAALEYSSVSGLVRHTRPRSGLLRMEHDALWALDDAGQPVPAELRWGLDVAAGDLLLIKYNFDATGRTWDHIGVLARDDGRLPGLLDGADALMHIGYLTGLVDEPMAKQGAATVQVVRFKPQLRKRLGLR
jgi:hypothetical protein